MIKQYFIFYFYFGSQERFSIYDTGFQVQTLVMLDQFNHLTIELLLQ